jgi:hypothetical protein
MDAIYETRLAPGAEKLAEIEHDYYHQQEMAKLTDGSENDCADVESSKVLDPFSDDELWSSGDDICRDSKLKRNLAEGRNLNNSFG